MDDSITIRGLVECPGCSYKYATPLSLRAIHCIKCARTYKIAEDVPPTSEDPLRKVHVLTDTPRTLLQWAEYIAAQKGPLPPEQEEMISRHPILSYLYAYYPLGGRRFIKGEPAVLTEPQAALAYSIHIIGDRWPEAEDIIYSDPDYWRQYAEYFGIQELVEVE